MKWKLKRKMYRFDGIFGTLTSEDGQHVFQTLEHAFKIENEHFPTSVEYYPKIQEGLHPCKIYSSPKHGYDVPLLDAPEDQGHMFEVHIGNRNKDSNGCILVGDRTIVDHDTGGFMITSSEKTFKKLMDLGVEEIDIVGMDV